MKPILIILFTFLSINSFGQNCQCESDTLLKSIISCDTIKFDNNASLYWGFNCDSCWLTFQDAKERREVLFSMGGGLQELTGRLGFIYVQEYRDYFLIQNNVISGCCTPPDFYLFNKTTGKEEKSLGPILFHSENKEKPFIVGFKGDDSTVNYDDLIIYNIDTKKEYTVGLVKGEMAKALEETGDMYPEYYFEEPVLNGDLLTLTYNLRQSGNKSKSIRIDLKKYY